MANTFKSIQKEINVAEEVVYTCPASTTAVVIGMRLGNKLANDIAVAAYLVRGAIKSNVLGETTPIPVGSALEGVMGSKLVMQAADSLTVKGSSAVCGNVTLSVMEIAP